MYSNAKVYKISKVRDILLHLENKTFSYLNYDPLLIFEKSWICIHNCSMIMITDKNQINLY